MRGYRTALGGAVGCARNPQLVQLLLDAGADIADGPTLWEGSALWEAIHLQDRECLSLLLNADPPHWQKCHALAQSLKSEAPDIVESLLSTGADPNWTMASGRSMVTVCMRQSCWAGAARSSNSSSMQEHTWSSPTGMVARPFPWHACGAYESD